MNVRILHPNISITIQSKSTAKLFLNKISFSFKYSKRNNQYKELTGFICKYDNIKFPLEKAWIQPLFSQVMLVTPCHWLI